MPLTFVLQAIKPLLVGLAGWLCLRVRASDNAYHHAAWRITGIAFLWHAASDLAQNVFGGIAIRAGGQSATMKAYLVANPVMNHGRTFLVYGLLLSLVAIAFYPREPDRRFWRMALMALSVGFVAGSAVGVHEGGFNETRHYSAVAIWDVIELVMLMAALFALLVTNRADRLLWAFLSAYGVALALGVFWFTDMAQRALGAWQPPTWILAATRLLFDALLVSIAARRLACQRNARPVHGMLGRPMPRLSTLR